MEKARTGAVDSAQKDASRSVPSLALTPHGRLRIEAAVAQDGQAGGERIKPILAAFERGQGHGLLHLGAVEVATLLPPTFAFWRDFAKLFMSRFCALQDLEEDREAFAVAAPHGELSRLLDTAPPMTGGEYLSSEVLMALWAELAAVLRPYQAAGVSWLWTLKCLGLGGCLADDMGLGKTIQVLGLLLRVRSASPAGTSLLVVPASLVANWMAEIRRFAPSLKTFVAHPSAAAASELHELSPKEVAKHDVVLTSYGMLGRLEWVKSYSWELAVLDEAQAIKNPAAKQTRAVKALRSRARFALTGTPVENRLSDLWSLFDFINPGLLGSAPTFTRFAKGLESRSENRYGPLRALIAPYILRRLKSDRSVIRDLPDKTEVRAFCSLARAQAALYQEAVDALAGKIKDVEGIERRGVVLSFLSRLKQILNHPSQWLGDGDWSPEASGKFLRLREICAAIAERQEKVLVFSQYREMTGPLADFLGGVFGRPGLTLHGGTAVKQRSALVERFQEDEAVPFFMISLKAGGTGLNLTAAAHVIHFDRWWNPAVEDQATDRAYRIGQKKNVLVHKFVCRDPLRCGGQAGRGSRVPVHAQEGGPGRSRRHCRRRRQAGRARGRRRGDGARGCRSVGCLWHRAGGLLAASA